MTEGSLVAFAAQVSTSVQESPTAQQIARFEELASQSVNAQDFARYGAPLPGEVAPYENFRSMLDYAGKVSGEFRTELERPPLQIDAQLWPDLHFVQQAQLQVRDFMRLELQVELIGKGLHLANRNVQVLYQQQG